MDFSVIVNQVMTLFIVMIIGFISRKVGIINSEVNKKLSEILLLIASPAMIFSSFLFEFSREKLVNMIYVLAFTFFIFIVSIVFATLVTRGMPENEKPVMKSSLVFTNCGYMGFPVLGAVLGREGIFYTSIFVAVYLVFLWTYGVFTFSGKGNIRSLKKALLSPSLIAVYVGIPMFLFQIPIPTALEDAANMVGSMNMPLAMLIIGVIFAEADLKKMFSGWKAYVGVFMRLVLLPAIVYMFGWLFRLPDIVLFVCVTLVAMPVGANIAVFAEKYDKNPFLASQMVTISTFFSMLTIPIILYLM